VEPQIDVIIVTYNSQSVIGDLLDSLPAALNGLVADVVVVDNGSTDDTAALVEARSDCRLVRSQNVGYAGGINRGVREAAAADAILVLNPDVRLHERSIPPLLKALQTPRVGIVAPQIRSPDGNLTFSLRRTPSIGRSLGLTGTKLAAFSEYINRRSVYTSQCFVDWALGAVLLMSRECLESIGGWDETYFLYSEETDVCLRALDSGFLTLYEPAAVAFHIGGQSGQNSKIYAMRSVNRIRLYRRRHGILASWCYFWLTVAFELRWAIRGNDMSWAAIRAILIPSERPAELGCSRNFMPS
jgi:N-acetylglucosaminyl-diphospho-decaprenol L-rhamnosyltransferase